HPLGDGRGLPEADRLTNAHAHDDEAIDPSALAGELEDGQPDDVILRTVGIDIGSTTSHAMFARLRLQRLADSLSSRYVVVEREVVDTGAVILTGAALERHNARELDELFAREGGKFVCATAGHALEATLAAHGSGAVARSRREGTTIIHVDIGGGTTK